jgi:CheY-like chemotaxis protein
VKRILFVDDESKILEGLQRMLRPERHRWEMAFASGGAAALSLLEAAPFDVIVSDMRMPGMDGAALLNVVRAKYPNVYASFFPATPNKRRPSTPSRSLTNFCSSPAIRTPCGSPLNAPPASTI